MTSSRGTDQRTTEVILELDTKFFVGALALGKVSPLLGTPYFSQSHVSVVPVFRTFGFESEWV